MTPDMARRASAPAKVHRLRRATEVLLAPWVLKRRLPALAGGGLIVVSAKVGGLKFLIKPADRWDPNLLNIAALLVRNGNVVWDIGANVGLFSRAASFHADDAGAVLAVEADLDAIALLNRMRTHIASGHAAIEVLPVAVSKVCGFVHFDIAMRARAANAISGYGSTQTGGKGDKNIACRHAGLHAHTLSRPECPEDRRRRRRGGCAVRCQPTLGFVAAVRLLRSARQYAFGSHGNPRRLRLQAMGWRQVQWHTAYGTRNGQHEQHSRRPEGEMPCPV